MQEQQQSPTEKKRRVLGDTFSVPSRYIIRCLVYSLGSETILDEVSTERGGQDGVKAAEDRLMEVKYITVIHVIVYDKHSADFVNKKKWQ